MDLGLADRVYLLTGASRGLGFATAECLAADGARLVVSARNRHAVDAAAERLGPNAVGVVADLADPAAAATLVDTAVSRFGRLDGALISVGGPPPVTTLDVTDAQWHAAFDTIFLGALRVVRAAAPVLGEGSAIGLVLSTSVRVPVPGLGISNGLRPGLAGVAKDLADQLGPHGIRVFGLLPGRIMTDRNVDLFAASGDPVAARAEVEAGIPLRRIGEPAEFGRVAAFALSPAASYLSGITIPVDGGALRAI
jgi:3-oxoacyl-[acyl-carrier protein] reductase